MAKNIIALIFPEYADTGNFPTSKEWEVENLPEDSVLKEWLKKIYSFIDFYKDEISSMTQKMLMHVSLLQRYWTTAIPIWKVCSEGHYMEWRIGVQTEFRL